MWVCDVYYQLHYIVCVYVCCAVDWFPALNQAGRKSVNHKITEPLAPVLVERYVGCTSHSRNSALPLLQKYIYAVLSQRHSSQHHNSTLLYRSSTIIIYKDVLVTCTYMYIIDQYFKVHVRIICAQRTTSSCVFLAHQHAVHFLLRVHLIAIYKWLIVYLQCLSRCPPQITPGWGWLEREERARELRGSTEDPSQSTHPHTPTQPWADVRQCVRAKQWTNDQCGTTGRV